MHRLKNGLSICLLLAGLNLIGCSEQPTPATHKPAEAPPAAVSSPKQPRGQAYPNRRTHTGPDDHEPTMIVPERPKRSYRR